MPLLTVATTDHVATLTLNRPESMNALGQAGDGDAFAAACDAINGDSNIRCAILTGAGRAFSAGGDIKAMQNRTGNFAGSPADIADGYRNNIHRILRALYGLRVPLIGLVSTCPSATFRNRSGELDRTATSPKFRKAPNGAGLARLRRR